MLTLNWTGPFLVRDYLDNSINDEWTGRWPPASNGVYLVTQHEWHGEPTQECKPLYVGGNTGKSHRFCTRVGDLVADMYGFFDGGTGHHRGGQKVWDWCNTETVKVPPGSLWLAWADQGTAWCAPCAERVLFKRLRPLLNRNTPTGCGAPTCAWADI